MTAKSKPILFTGEMVRAILAGRKTQTRRVLKSPFPKQHPKPVNLAVHGEGDRGYSGEFNDPDSWGYPYAEDGCDMPLSDWPELNPYGNIGDYLWVRENFAVYGDDDKYVLHYQADLQRGSGWKPSIHMPRKFSRITLQITDIRVQRVQDITEQDALAEGITLPLPESYAIDCAEKICGAAAARSEFKRLWDSINWDRGYPWDFNPWVWAITFKPILKNIDDILAERPAA